jgi:hypothetical protein
MVALQSVTVKRPEPGLARGVWEAPWWAFLVAAALVLVLLAALFGRRLAKKTKR